MYIYTELGKYDVSLTVSDTSGNSSVTKLDYITTREQQDAQLMVTLATAANVDGIIDINDPWGDAWVGQDSISGTTYDMNSHFQISHDTENIYIVIEVGDTTPNNDVSIADTYQRDCIEAFFSMKSSNFDRSDYEVGDHQIRCQRANDDGNYIDGNSAGPDGNIWAVDPDLLAEMQYAVVSGSDGYVVEMGFPITTLAMTSDFDGANFRFDIVTSDNSNGEVNGRTQQSFWNSTSDLQWNNTSYLGSLALEGNSTGATSFPVTFSVVGEDSMAIEGVAINLACYFAQLTDFDGVSLFSTVLPSEVEYIVTKEGYINVDGVINLVDGAVNVDIVMIEGENSIDQNGFDNMLNTLKVYPNPVSDVLNVVIQGDVESLILYNMQGLVIYNVDEELIENKNYQFDVSGLPQGVYFIKADASTACIIVE